MMFPSEREEVPVAWEAERPGSHRPGGKQAAISRGRGKSSASFFSVRVGRHAVGALVGRALAATALLGGRSRELPPRLWWSSASRRRREKGTKEESDFLDPMHHKAATGRDSINLDGWMLSREANVASFKRCARDTDIAIVEGVMGLFDGRDGKSERGSTSEMAKFLGAPVVLVLDCWALARSAAAMIHGFTTFDRDLSFAGVVFNKVGGPAHSAWLREAVEGANVGVTVLGGVPRTPGINIPERHLGLHMPDDQGISADYIARLADLMELHVDLDAILQLAATDQGLRALPPVPNSYHHHHHHHQNHVHHHDPSQNHHHNHHNHHEQPQQPQQQMITLQTHQQTVGALNSQRRSVRIGVAKDAAFCFYYHENLALLEDAGAELVFFSPLKDPLPGQLDAIYFGGGYPELHAEELSQNTRLMYAVRAFATVGGIIYAECGGLMYLSQGIQTKDGEKFALCGVLPFWTRMVQRMVMGYVKVTLHEGCMLFPPDLKELRGHVYHFSEIADDMSSIDNSLMGHDSGALHYGYSMELQYPGAMVEQEGYQIGNVLASYVHLHFGSNPACAHFFVERCRLRGKEKEEI
ncbi:hypothetical protein CBR_g32417 [Chara braunii]|uniref:CobB/CobQ-like glutamine amidotransferase domain-containing protein n=1 Tax=Chara braunii TaxID=69332 RepID=A0A388JYQ1_CHABU|nr:hypothetical protein CBR_g32417 [Chara braunii]|eukprot:GBG62833.1 hypothetical protein CBR_g32417 [Chara braunii]